MAVLWRRAGGLEQILTSIGRQGSRNDNNYKCERRANPAHAMPAFIGQPNDA